LVELQAPLLEASPTALAGVLRIDRNPREDRRGFFSRLFCDDAFLSFGWDGAVRQINHTLTRAPGAIRGLHFQYPPNAEDKLVTCLQGEVFDVAVDLRRGSPTFLQWHGEILSVDNRRSLLIPKGCAHGFQALTADCMMLYLHSEPYHPASEGALNLRDPRLGIRWPMAIGEISERDAAHAMLTDQFTGLDI
jgi:dTDP-4-dehydrorhamnose 3,5-epimerase